jgi:hypothetical protein
MGDAGLHRTGDAAFAQAWRLPSVRVPIAGTVAPRPRRLLQQTFPWGAVGVEGRRRTRPSPPVDDVERVPVGGERDPFRLVVEVEGKARSPSPPAGATR